MSMYIKQTFVPLLLGNKIGNLFDDMKSSKDEDELGSMRSQWAEYAEATSLHGIKYMCEKGRPGFER